MLLVIKMQWRRWTVIGLGIGSYLLARKLFPDAVGDVNHHIASTVLYLASRTSDYTSTIAGIKEMERADNAGVQHEYEESNYFLSRRPKMRDLLSPRRLILEVPILTMAALNPHWAYGISAGSFFASASNLDVARRIRNDVEASESFQEELYD